MPALLARIEAAALLCVAWAERSALNRAALFLALGLLTVLPGLAALPPTDRDESRFIQASRQMIESGDLVDIRFQDEARWKKPVGIYWLQAASASLAGGAEAPVWAWRVPSALAALLAGLATVWALRPAIGARAALLGGLLLQSSLLLVVEGHIAKTDAVLLLCLILSQGGLLRLLGHGPARFGTAHAAFWGGIGAGLLVKGPVALLPAAGLLLWDGIARRSAAGLRETRPLPGLLLAGAIVLPWLVLIALRTEGGFFRDALLGDFLAKVTTGAERHWGPPGYHLAVIWGTLWPWAPLALFAAPALWRARAETGPARLIGWALPLWIVFELTATKLPHYVLPAFPALCGLLGWWLARPEKGEPGISRRILAAGLFALPGLVLALAAIVLVPLVEGRLAPLGLALGLVALLLLATGARALVERRVAGFLGAGLAASLLLHPTMFAVILPQIGTVFLSPRLAEVRAAFDPCSDRPLASVGYHEPSLVVAAGTDTRLIRDAEAARLLRDENGWLVFFEERRRATLAGFVASAGLELEILATVSGFNYNRGDRTTIFLVARAGDPTLGPCRSVAGGNR